MNINLYNLFVVFIVLNGCTTLISQKPSIRDLRGTWESTGQASYYQLTIEDEGNSFFVIVFDSENVKVYRLDSFNSLDNGFTAKFVDTEGDEDPVDIKGILMMGRLALEDKTSEKGKIWFLKTKNLEIFRNLANDRIHKEKHNQVFSPKPSHRSD